MSNIKVCPHCGGHQFMAFIKRGGLVECDGMDENGKATFKVIKEGAKGKYELEIIRCTTCQADVTENDLIGGVPCKTCGKLVNPTSLDENGNCEVCAMLVSNPQLKSASQDELLRLLARAMKGVKADTTLVQQKEAKAAEVDENLGLNEVIDSDNSEEALSAADAILNGEMPPDVQPTKPRRKRAVRRAADSNSETPTEITMPVSTEEPQEATEQIAQSQEAPFPDVEGMPNVPPVQAEPPAELPNPVGAGFQMFDGNEDDEPF